MPLYDDMPPGALSLDSGLVDTSGIDTSLGGPVAPPAKSPGLLGRIMQQPGGNRALLAFGAQLMSSPDFFTGFGNGALAYQNTLDTEADKLKPKMTKENTFTYTIDPATGEPTFKRTAVADFDENQLHLKLKAADALGRYRADSANDSSRYRADTSADVTREGYKYKDRWESAGNRTAIQIAEINAKAAGERAALAAATSSGKPPPIGALKEYDEYSGKVSSANSTLELGNDVLGTLEDGTLDLGLIANGRAKVASVTGLGANDSTRAYARMEQFAQSLVNATLMDARGVQTDGDAVRARIMALISSGDAEGAKAELRNAMWMIENARNHNASRASAISSQYGVQGDAPNTRPSVGGRAPSGRSGSLKQKYGLE